MGPWVIASSGSGSTNPAKNPLNLTAQTAESSGCINPAWTVPAFEQFSLMPMQIRLSKTETLHTRLPVPNFRLVYGRAEGRRNYRDTSLAPDNKCASQAHFQPRQPDASHPIHAQQHCALWRPVSRKKKGEASNRQKKGGAKVGSGKLAGDLLGNTASACSQNGRSL